MQRRRGPARWRRPSQPTYDAAPSGATPIYLNWCAMSSAGNAVSRLIWNTLMMRDDRSPFLSNDTVPCSVSSLVASIASRIPIDVWL